MTDRRAAGFRELEEALRAQADRIDELTRTCASLVEDNKAFRQRVEREKDRVLDAEKARLAQVLLETHDALELASRLVKPTPGGGLEARTRGENREAGIRDSEKSGNEVRVLIAWR